MTTPRIKLNGKALQSAAKFHWARVVNTWVDHHGTCAKWLARVERQRRERAAGQATKAGRG